jgi:hypothetical protein
MVYERSFSYPVNSTHIHSSSRLQNPFMGFSDFRAAFTANTNVQEWSVSPNEGSLNGRGDPTEFLVKFRASNPGVSEGYLVVETEEDKWTWKLLGTGSM